MNTIDALNSRYCCRAFKPDRVSKETVLKILEAATRAPVVTCASKGMRLHAVS